jgi:hypothetical protein
MDTYRLYRLESADYLRPAALPEKVQTHLLEFTRP